MAVREYVGKGEIQFDGRSLAESESITFTIDSQNNEVVTMKRGLAGKSDGPTRSELTVRNAVPKAGLEVDFIAKCVAKSACRISLIFAGKRIQWEGWIQSVDGDLQTNASAGLSFRVIAGEPIIL